MAFSADAASRFHSLQFVIWLWTRLSGGTEAPMARTTGRLTALKVEKTKEAGMYADGGGLYLRVTGKAPRIGCCATC